MGDFPKNSHGELQHPRRSLGNRYRTQAEKFLRLSQTDATNLSWAEQNARQSLLYDFTNPKNWRVLVKIKTISGDSEGLRAVIEDLVVVLGRNPEHLGQLSEVDVLSSSEMIVDGILKSDPLDPDEWWKSINDDKEAIDDFSERIIRSEKDEPGKPKGRDALFMGLGDVIFPGMLVISSITFLPEIGPIVFDFWGDPTKPVHLGPMIVGMGTLVGGLLGYIALMTQVARGRPQAGLPLLNGGSILGYLVSGTIALGLGNLWQDITFL